MNIFGESFPKEIIDQIKLRQKHHGSQKRTPNELAYLNSKTGWCKLVSSIDIKLRTDETGKVVDPDDSDLERLKLIGVSKAYSGNELAKEFVLFNGTSTQVGNKITQRGGVSTNDSIVNDNAYGLGGLEFGLSPMPGITSAEIKTLNRGSIKESTVQIKAFNRTQFQIIDALYLRLGYPILLEWGHSIYFDNNDQYHNGNDQDWSISDEFLSGKLDDYFKILNKIQKNRIASNGNYDALLGKVKNFNWTFNTDGSFNITLSIISVGDIIESLQMNSLLPDIPLQSPTQNPDEEVPISAYNKHSIGKILNGAKFLIDEGGIKDNSNMTSYSFPSTSPKFHTGKKDIVKVEWIGHDPTYYYRFGSLLQVIENLLLIYTKKGTPIIKIDYDDANYVFHSPLQISTDPSVCIIRNRLGNSNVELFPGCEKYELGINGTIVGVLMNVYINFDFILNTIDSNIDSEGKVSLISLLDKICGGINDSLGSKNMISATIDEVTNRIVFIDETPIPNVDKVVKYLLDFPEYKDKILGSTTEVAEFDVYGYRYISGSSAGFIKNLNLSTTISPDLATIITVGATANGKVVGEDATAFSKWNVALKNRITETLIDSSTQTSLSIDTSEQTVEEVYKDAWKGYLGFVKELSEYRWDDTNFSTYSSALRTFLDAQTSIISSRKTDRNGTLSTGFLPLNLSLTMEGLSGMKVYQQFKIDVSYLPSNYPPIFKFLIKTIVHKIENNIWTTQLETMSASTSTLKLDNPTSLNRVNTRGTSPTQITPAVFPPNEIIQAMKRYGIIDPKEKAHFLAQCAHESGGFRFTKEFSTGQQYEGNRELGNIQPGDGVKYKGRGYIQVTGRANYNSYNNYLKSKGDNNNILQKPELLETPYYAADSACYWWRYLSRNIKTLALAGTSASDVSKVSTRINGANPAKGLNDRQAKFDKYWLNLQNNPTLYS
jgi:putative chitinase